LAAKKQWARYAKPVASRPAMPASYGVERKPSAGMVDWGALGERLASARNYWVATTRPDGRPHAVPVWGLWLDGAFYFATDRASRKGRNLRANPALVVHLESGDDVVILEGRAEEVSNRALLARFADAYEAKYQFRPVTGNPAQVVHRLRPRTALSWREGDFVRSATRWRFGGD